MTSTKNAILFVIENERYGGGERAFAQLINGLDKERFEVYAACLTGNPCSDVFTREIGTSARVINLDLRRLFNPGAVLELKGIIRDNNIKIVHSQGARADFYARVAARLAGAAAVSTVAAPVEEYDVNCFRRAVYTALDRLLCSSTDKYIAVAGHLLRKLADGRGVPPEKVIRIYNGIDAALYACTAEQSARARSAHNIPAGCFLAAAFCRLSPEKGLFSLVEAAAKTGSAEPVKYLVAGEGPLGAELKARVKSLGLEKDFIFTGFVEDIRPLLCAADLVVLPSLREGFPVILLEAMAAGKPVVASKIAGIDESVEDGRTGLLVPPGDGAALAAAITGLCGNRGRALEMGENGRAAVREKFGIDKMITAHEAVYTEVLARRSGH
ncbi:MAG: glycosyltransferase family 4 protein [Elusimicrobiota bacterium]|nr:glycosyltransferase family 4 protein [Elusimicrobiota bacterium]